MPISNGLHHSSTTANTSQVPLASGGGAVEVAPSVYLSLWGRQWQSGFSTGGYTSSQAIGYVQKFFSGVGGSSWTASTEQYCQNVPAGTTSCPSSAQFITSPTGQLKGSWIDTTSVPSSPTDADIQAAAERAFSHFGLVAGATYLVLTPTGHGESGFGTQWCAWHASDYYSSRSVAYAYLPYLPDAGAACGMNYVNATNDSFGNGYLDGFSIVGGHEYAEAITDPYPSSGWTDANGDENADKCQWSNGPAANTTLSTGNFAVQSLWSNGSGSCVLNAVTPSPSPSPQSAAASLGGVLASEPAVTSWSSNRLDVFVRGTDNQLWHRWWDGTAWSAWEPQGGVLSSAPATVSWGLNRVDVFVRGTDNQLWHKWWDGTRWSTWEPLGGVLASAPTVASWSANRLDVFAEGTDGQLWHKWWDGTGWQGWEPLGGRLSADPGAASSAANRIDVVVRGTDGQMWHKSWNGSTWSVWDSQAGALASGPAAVTTGAGALDALTLLSGGSLWQKSFAAGQWGSWTSDGGQWTSDPSAVSRTSGQLDVFVRGGDNALWHLVVGT